MTGPLRRLGVVVPAIALALAGFGALVGGGAVRPPVPALDVGVPGVGWLLLGAVLVAAAQLAMLRVRVGTGTVGLAWGESAIVVLCVLVPLAWIPLVTVVGVGVARVVQALRSRRPVREMAYGVGVLTLAATVGA